ncbi:hypothetical protein ACF1G5_25490 [Streptomyces coeruleorubidus]|uniref:hypothetical protein n=1 Tax=Streptomyces coeruleorubidus TaxID=116188 RepID=UPI0036F9AB0D
MLNAPRCARGNEPAPPPYRLVARHSGEAAEVVGRRTANGTKVQQWPWIIPS